MWWIEQSSHRYFILSVKSSPYYDMYKNVSDMYLYNASTCISCLVPSYFAGKSWLLRRSNWSLQFFSVKLMFKKNKNQHKPAGSGPFKKTFVLVTLARNKQQTLHRLHRKRVLLQSTEITIIDRVIPAKNNSGSSCSANTYVSAIYVCYVCLKSTHFEAKNSSSDPVCKWVPIFSKKWGDYYRYNKTPQSWTP